MKDIKEKTLPHSKIKMNFHTKYMIRNQTGSKAPRSGRKLVPKRKLLTVSIGYYGQLVNVDTHTCCRPDVLKTSGFYCSQIRWKQNIVFGG